MANLKLKLGQEVEIGKIDSAITITNTNNKKIGELHFSKGSVEWWPKGNSVNCRTYNWTKLAELLSANGQLKKVPKIKEVKTTAKKMPVEVVKPVVKRIPRTPLKEVG
ncbi:hypothetical protein [Janthinobacterium fluminis]|uniref:Uncharacterized protein n=1 Tax=Janthinobacterium fluminis TaxID=2987524 RepID=A0ABT5K2E2_9BURK|nr:hypothetical protein [Janthinobacterium fluminis]MDC8759044.1 hypothetical protein [Janthinobacterium fluminis]